MASDMQLRDAYAMLLSECSDENIERVTGLDLNDILALRAGQASAPRHDLAISEHHYSALSYARGSIRTVTNRVSKDVQ
jgi:hypothetical protein